MKQIVLCSTSAKNDMIVGMVIEFGGVKIGEYFKRRSKACCAFS